MIDAWQYATAAIERGMTPTAGYHDYREGGGVIRTADWYSLTTLASEAKAAGDMLVGQPWETPIPGQAYTSVDTDYGQKYVVTADINYIDAATGEVVRRHVTVEADEVRTWGEIEEDIDAAGAGYGAVGGTAGIQIERARFYQARWSEL